MLWKGRGGKKKRDQMLLSETKSYSLKHPCMPYFGCKMLYFAVTKFVLNAFQTGPLQTNELFHFQNHVVIAS